MTVAIFGLLVNLIYLATSMNVDWDRTIIWKYGIWIYNEETENRTEYYYVIWSRLVIQILSYACLLFGSLAYNRIALLFYMFVEIIPAALLLSAPLYAALSAAVFDNFVTDDKLNATEFAHLIFDTITHVFSIVLSFYIWLCAFSFYNMIENQQINRIPCCYK